MEKGKLLGSGVTAEVYEWGKDKVLKLYFDKYSNDEWVNHETEMSRLVHKSGIISPAVYNEVEIDGRRGTIYQRIFGKSIRDQLIEQPWELYNYLKQAAAVQYNIHSFSIRGLPSQMERLTQTINISSDILGYRLRTILEYMESLPDGKSICHGDFYFNNIIISGKKLVPIDWNSAYTGNPLGDLARTCIIISSPAIPPGFPESIAMLTTCPRIRAYRVYINEYMKLSGARFEDFDKWILPVAASRLKNQVNGEKNWLMDMIDKRLERLR
jgi:tRNA A-37 threonylcarbamoyl transferase component Bud32